ncbi:TIR domain-containing protein [Roseiconus lacunae]|uniref:TIR domain-containing protein n=1 Tax=Roseiconus lacunae TaxID=2605694 RepID=UPI00308817BF|nr:TIR domain-containing protein [Stieleria sp. HD01]
MDNATRDAISRLAKSRVAPLDQTLQREISKSNQDLIGRGFYNSSIQVTSTKAAGERNLVERAEMISNTIKEACKSFSTRYTPALGDDLKNLFTDIFQEQQAAVQAHVEKAVPEQNKGMCPINQVQPDINQYVDSLALFAESLKHQEPEIHLLEENEGGHNSRTNGRKSTRSVMIFYNFLVSANGGEWDKGVFEFGNDRCLEFTDADIKERFFRFGETRIDEILSYPAILAYETAVGEDPHLGRVTAIRRRNRLIRVRTEIEHRGFLSHDELMRNSLELDIESFEFNREHWSIKRVDLASELRKIGVKGFPINTERPYVDLENYQFSVALSFPGGERALVEDIACRLEQRMGVNECFYDDHYVPFLARPSLDTLLQRIYGNARLNVVFISAEYQEKEWCGLEWRQIRQRIKERQFDTIMLVRTDDGSVEGVMDSDGYVDARKYSADQIAFFIEQRARVV